jgi:uncharacterized protein (TIGR03437 family)
MTQNPPFLSRSTDSGRTWTPLNIAPPNQPAFPRALVFDSTNPQNLILGQSVSGLLKSSDGGDTWVPLTGLEVLAVLNEDFTFNSASNPAKAGSVIILYIGGAGQTNPPSQDGQLNSLPPAQPGAPVRVAFGATPYTVNFAGAAPGLAAGILQVNFVAPQQTTTNVSVRVGQSFALFSVAIQ